MQWRRNIRNYIYSIYKIKYKELFYRHGLEWQAQRKYNSNSLKYIYDHKKASRDKYYLVEPIARRRVESEMRTEEFDEENIDRSPEI